MSVSPIRDSIVVSKDAGPEKTQSGLYIAHTEEKNVTGTILAVGSGRVSLDGSTVIPLAVNVGDKVLFNKNMAQEVKDGDTTVLVLREDAIICVIR